MEPPWGFYHQRRVARMLGITNSEAASLANNPLPAVQIPDGADGLVWAFRCEDVDARLGISDPD